MAKSERWGRAKVGEGVHCQNWRTRWGGGGVDITMLIAQEVGSGKSERRRERVVANIGTVSKELLKKREGVDPGVCANTASCRSQGFLLRVLFPSREGKCVAVISSEAAKYK